MRCLKKVMKEYVKSNFPKSRKKPVNKKSKGISKKVKDFVYVRDGGQCTYVGKNGKRCKERFCLEYDHKYPKALGGSNTVDNIRLLCSTHNKYMAEKIFGKRKVVSG